MTTKLISKISCGLVGTLIGIYPILSSATTKCAGSYLPNGDFVSITETDWRSTSTISTLTSKQAVATSQTRESLIQKEHKDMVDEIMGNQKDTPHMRFFVEEGVSQKELIASKYTSGNTPRIEVSGLNGDVVRATILLPVSGHAGTQNAIKWSKEDKFDLSFAYGDKGSRTHRIDHASLKPLARQVTSRDLMTAMEIEIPLIRDANGNLEPVTIYYHRLGLKSYLGAPEGYWEGRVLTLVFN